MKSVFSQVRYQVRDQILNRLLSQFAYKPMSQVSKEVVERVRIQMGVHISLQIRDQLK